VCFCALGALWMREEVSAMIHLVDDPVITERLAQEYASALEAYISGAGESALTRAYDLGRQAVKCGLNVLQLARMHHEALRTVMARNPLNGGQEVLMAAAQFLTDTLSPFEITLRLDDALRKAKTAAEEVNRELQREIAERKRAEVDLIAAHKRMVEISREAGMAEVATGVLHNVGNVLNSVNVSANLLVEYIQASKASSLARVIARLREHEQELGEFVTSHPQGKYLIAHLQSLDRHLAAEREASIRELNALRESIDHIKDIVVMQQSYAKFVGVQEEIKVTDLVEDGLRLNAAALSRHRIEIIREYEDAPVINVDKHAALQILVNLISNAKRACVDTGRTDGRVTLRVEADDKRTKLLVRDNGVGIPPENLTRIFGHGFTTREGGHGFGLHRSALVARELGGSLTAHSEGPGRGATFTLELPLR
jgi:signal transduction histidine kinase